MLNNYKQKIEKQNDINIYRKIYDKEKIKNETDYKNIKKNEKIQKFEYNNHKSINK